MSKEIGRIGQRRYGGVIYEEFLPELRGSRGVRQVRLSIRLKTRLAHWTVRRQMWM